MKPNPSIMLLIACLPLFSQCESTDGSTPDRPRAESLDERHAAMMPGSDQMLYGYRVGTGSAGPSRGWVANPDAMVNPFWR